ncbi:MAG TPA: PQQ-binding-like beta-propeller repeat protein [Chryseolinea sp.]
MRITGLIALAMTSFTLLAQTPANHQNDNAEDFENLPALQWKFATNAPIFGSPLVADGIVYIGSLDSSLYAIEMSSGKLKWKLRTGGEIRSTVCLSGDKLFLYSGDATLYSINRVSGKVVWTFKTKGGVLGDRRYDFADYFQSSPVAFKNRIYFGAGDGRVYAVNASDGTLLWNFKSQGIMHTTPTLYKDRLFIGSFDGNLYALQAETGDLLWKFKTVGHRYFPDGEIQGSPVVANDLVYFGARDYNLYAIDVYGGYSHWNKSFPFGWAMAVTPGDSVVYVGTSDDRVLVALDGKSGMELWRTDVKFNVFGPCVTTPTMAYVGTLMGKLFGINLKNGSMKWVFTTPGYQKNHLKYFKADDSFRDDISNLIKTPADFIGMEYSLGAIFSSPAISNGQIVFGSTDGTVYCLKK